MARNLGIRKSFAERMNVAVPNEKAEEEVMSPSGMQALIQGKSRPGAKKKSVTRGGREEMDMETLAPAALLDAAQKGAAKDILTIKESAMKLDMDVCDENGRTSLMWAAELGYVPVIATLLHLGADRMKKDTNFGRSALHCAARAGNVDTLKALMEGLKPKEQSTYVNEHDANGFTALFLAQQRGEAGAAAYSHLLSTGAVVDQCWQALGPLPPPPPAAGPPVVRRSIIQAYDI